MRNCKQPADATNVRTVQSDLAEHSIPCRHLTAATITIIRVSEHEERITRYCVDTTGETRDGNAKSNE